MANEFVTRRGIISLGGITFPYYSTTTAYAVTDDDYFVDCLSGTFNVSLPNSNTVTAGKIFIIKNSGAGIITVDPYNTETIDGSTTKTLSQNQSICITSRGPNSNWSSFGQVSVGGITSLDPIGAVPNVNGATITGTILNLQPASANYGGVITTGTQTFAGSKTFNSDVKLKTIYYGQGTGTGYATNILISDHTLPNSTIGGNIIIGKGSGASITTGTSNVAIGKDSFALNITGNYNTAVGDLALSDSINGNSNTAVGASALSDNKVGGNNTAIGVGTLNTATESNCNTALGFQSMNQVTGNNNTAVGHNSCRLTKGDGNVVIGYLALSGFNSIPTTCSENTVIGRAAMLSSTGTNNNVAIGNSAAFNISTGSQNVVIGSYAGGTLGTGSNNIIIGYAAEPSTSSVTNECTIGKLGMTYRIYSSSWNNASDIRMKHDVQDIPVGLDFISKLRPVQFIYNDSATEDRSMGFIAQEVKQVVDDNNLDIDIVTVFQDEDQILGLKTTELVPVLVKAIQELKAEIEQLKATINSSK